MSATKDAIINDLDNKQILIEISIDCDPYQKRPNTYFEIIWTEILRRDEPVPEDEVKRRFFGAWFWKVKVSEKEKEAILAYCRKLYNENYIRGAKLSTINE